MLNTLNYSSLFIIVHVYLVFSFDIFFMFYIDSKRITHKIISKKIMYELQYNNTLWKWKKILEPIEKKSEKTQRKTFKRTKKCITEVQHWENLLVHLTQVTQSFFSHVLLVYGIFYEIDLYFALEAKKSFL